MSSRLSVLLFSALACTSAVGFAACSSETTVTEAPDAGSDASKPGTPKSDAGSNGGDSGATQTYAECVAACETKHAAGLAKDKAIDTCWAQSCQGPCIDGNGVFDAGIPDGGDAGDDAGDGGAGQCKNAIETGDDACNDCTAAFCCGAWDGCFNDQDCTELNDCRSACPED